ncbi:MAG: hypothetical protein A2268_12865 [Candidatus Raymondbacteria bacterium RifOxyA12_full_50_37]|uniref:EF-hand domain-containing protein n=1 Tax=Candidatus Raymondbacteria bacterium RIFOXYD12_FULL_49_13 TaxID=1817890 RepID=A0A1F7FIZ1_UNCRA|nr:MAG: hypothetical protein A2268_12865 [Candidatus Raymondbacteria bacterium RifOxyA12_full_50_37]OGJ90772.1 MAG: hypothetical protein A2248_02125 [Candidatus Raymondbacteria bacterium RIFOXYA2_FULL_49_16]OGJ91651.1 MAG: hypothetical protein A2350_00410 [Candidatus Raymondbacteria bacterium RifOxyB12_full_50_8]OGJ97266.1 MAG: hypothetical protein A2487_16315 [Candidatus Raymondbacteria bacterium RifOxyC12_full_50_8]OGJ97339.1 MAG: hypothetical protein A2453_03405 [Candidatus Raymondbacteria b
MLNNIRKNDKGYALTEIIVSLFLVTLAAEVIYLNYSFIYKSSARWSKNTAAVTSLETGLHRLEHEFSHLYSIDTAETGRMVYTSDQFQKRHLTTRPELTLNNKLIFDTCVQVDSVGFYFFGSDSTRDFDKDGVVEMADLDKNHNGRLEADETAAIDFIRCSLFLTIGKKPVHILSQKRLLRKSIHL